MNRQNSTKKLFTIILSIMLVFSLMPMVYAAGDAHITTKSLPQGTVGKSYSATISATGDDPLTIFWDGDGPGPLPDGLSVKDNGDGTAVLKGTPTVAGTYEFCIAAENDYNGHSEDHHTFTLVINSSSVSYDPVSFTTTSLPDGTVGQKYEGLIGTEGGKPGSVEISEWFYGESQGVPAGLKFSDNGYGKGGITGTPKKAGKYKVSFCVSDPYTEEYITYTLVIKDSVTPAKLTTNELPSGVAGEEYKATVKAEGGAKLSITTSSKLPEGLKYKDNGNGSGTISGTPAAAGTYKIKFTASNDGGSDSKELTIFIEEPGTIQFDTPTVLPNAKVGEEYKAEIKGSASYGVPKISYSGGTLPVGITFVTGDGTGLLLGSPLDAGTYSIEALCEYGDYSVTETFTLTVDEADETSSSLISSSVISSFISTDPVILPSDIVTPVSGGIDITVIIAAVLMFILFALIAVLIIILIKRKKGSIPPVPPADDYYNEDEFDDDEENTVEDPVLDNNDFTDNSSF